MDNKQRERFSAPFVYYEIGLTLKQKLGKEYRNILISQYSKILPLILPALAPVPGSGFLWLPKWEGCLR